MALYHFHVDQYKHLWEDQQVPVVHSVPVKDLL